MMKKLLVATLFLMMAIAPVMAQTPPSRLPAQVTASVTSNLVAKASSGVLYSAMMTTGATGGCFFIFNATSLPANGSVTPALAPISATANTTVSVNFAPGPPMYFATGIVIGFSSTCGLTFTASSTALINAMVQ